MEPEQAGNSDLVMPKISFGFNFGRDKIISRKYTYVVIDCGRLFEYFEVELIALFLSTKKICMFFLG